MELVTVLFGAGLDLQQRNRAGLVAHEQVRLAGRTAESHFSADTGPPPPRQPESGQEGIGVECCQERDEIADLALPGQQAVKFLSHGDRKPSRGDFIHLPTVLPQQADRSEVAAMNCPGFRDGAAGSRRAASACAGEAGEGRRWRCTPGAGAWTCRIPAMDMAWTYRGPRAVQPLGVSSDAAPKRPQEEAFTGQDADLRRRQLIHVNRNDAGERARLAPGTPQSRGGARTRLLPVLITVRSAPQGRGSEWYTKSDPV